ncbi:aldo/keto reductase [Candidatus Woesearchaeota archaeon]|nr:aldo/keto reductase [Candidatus Woesearchaeota archaeon]
MKNKKLSNGKKIPVIGIGTWGIGGNFEADSSKEREEIRIIQQAIDFGIRHIDTAELYGQGQTEKEIGKAIRKFDREKLFITTKVWKTNLNYDNVIISLKKSLKRLQTNYVDLYLVHWPNTAIPLKETMKAMEYLAEQGKIRAIGVSNFSVVDLKKAQKYLRKHKIAANQIEYSLIRREAERELIPFCVKNSVTVIAYRPLAGGELARKGIKILDQISKKYGKTNAQIALKWIVSHKNVVAITKSSSLQHIKENIKISGWNLRKRDMGQLNKLFPVV